MKLGDKVISDMGIDIEIKKKLGSGGQGSVYEVEYAGKPKALKCLNLKSQKLKMFYYNNYKEQERNGAPSENFYWPEDTFITDDGDVGYVMPLKPKEYYEMEQILSGVVSFSSYKAMVDFAMNIVVAFRSLHKSGYSYQDLNEGNFFVNPKTGHCFIADNDNAVPYGVSTGIRGIANFMAPEVIHGKAPNSSSDKFSISIVLFYLFVMNHPFDGRLMSNEGIISDEVEKKYYGNNPVFIFSEQNDNNRPVKGTHINAIERWPQLPDYLREAFLEAFSKEMINQEVNRITPKRWINILQKLRNSIVKCSCSEEVFTNSDSCAICHECGKEVKAPIYLRVGAHVVPIFPGQQVCEYHIRRDSESLRIVGEIVVDDDNPKVWKLKNLDTSSWKLIIPNGKEIIVEEQRRLKVALRCKIDFNGCTGEFTIGGSQDGIS